VTTKTCRINDLKTKKQFESTFCPVPSDMINSSALFGSSHASYACSSDNSGTKTRKKMRKYTFLSNAPRFSTERRLFKVSRLRLFVLLARVDLRRRRMWSIGGVIMTGENRSRLLGKTSSSAILFTTNLTRTGPGSKLDLRGERMVRRPEPWHGLTWRKWT
jgi:hypothetical protein